METVRFAKVVASCGKPEVYLLWVPAKKDAELQKAIAADRVMMIHQESVGTKQDFGEVGFQEGVRGQILVFPKTLEAFRGKRVVGIQYDALAADEKKKIVAPAKKQPKTDPPPPGPQKARKSARSNSEPAPREEPKLIPFIPPENAEPTEHAEIHALREEVQRAMDALEEGRHVAAYKILQAIVKD